MKTADPNTFVHSPLGTFWLDVMSICHAQQTENDKVVSMWELAEPNTFGITFRSFRFAWRCDKITHMYRGINHAVNEIVDIVEWYDPNDITGLTDEYEENWAPKSA